MAIFAQQVISCDQQHQHCALSDRMLRDERCGKWKCRNLHLGCNTIKSPLVFIFSSRDVAHGNEQNDRPSETNLRHEVRRQTSRDGGRFADDGSRFGLETKHLRGKTMFDVRNPNQARRRTFQRATHRQATGQRALDRASTMYSSTALQYT